LASADEARFMPRIGGERAGGKVAGSDALELLGLALLPMAVGRWRVSRRRSARGADAATHRDFPRHYHTDLDQFLPRP